MNSPDLIIRNGRVIDGTGAPAFDADVEVTNGKISFIGTSTSSAANEIDAHGSVVAPGFVDIHTHYDAQLLWDQGASPSANHGVTTVIAGNCGFTLAPLRPTAAEAEYLQEMMSRVEGIAAQDVTIGLRVCAKMVEESDGVTRPVFEPMAHV